MEDIKCLLTRFNNSWLEYCNGIINKDADVLVKTVICIAPLLLFSMNEFVSPVKKKQRKKNKSLRDLKR